MNDVYGIDPSAPSDLRDFAQLMRVFEIDQGRFIADYPGGAWFSELCEHMEALTDIDQMRIRELWLRVGSKAMVPVSGKFHRGRSWPENAPEIRGDVVKLIGAKGCPATLSPIDRVLMDPDGFPDASEGHIPRTADAYAKAARPLLQTSPKIVLVDPYFKLRYFDEPSRQFRPCNRYRKPLEALLREAVKWGRVEIFRVEISEKEALKDDSDGDIFGAQLEALAVACDAGSIELQWDLLDADVSLDRHARYLLGMQRGLHFDWGFDTGDASTTNHIAWIGKSALQPLLKRFT